ncbi:hypothetical protein L0Y65_05270 [Candidatus Micrarchaeota archaeon]|nr:hypothetical protein [Candidatus Micrarchaeota archaeon]
MNAPFSLLALSILMLAFGCTSTTAQEQQSAAPPSRGASIPADAIKITPASDIYPPILHSGEWDAPIPIGAPVNTAGAEDSPFVTPDGNTLYFFFTPDPGIPAEKQLLDNVTGIWASRKSGGKWGEPSRVVLQDAGRLSLDGCEFVQGDRMWFCSAREGYSGIHWFTAEYAGGKWRGWKDADFKAEYEVGELHIASDGQELYFHSSRNGGRGGLDIWSSQNIGGKWQEPVNIGAVNSADDEGWPFVSQNRSELWFTRFYQGSPALFRSSKTNGTWSEPELIISRFAGEPTLDNAGNLYFVHHFFKDGKMLEADIYVAYRKAG